MILVLEHLELEEDEAFQKWLKDRFCNGDNVTVMYGDAFVKPSNLTVIQEYLEDGRKVRVDWFSPPSFGSSGMNIVTIDPPENLEVWIEVEVKFTFVGTALVKTDNPMTALKRVRKHVSMTVEDDCIKTTSPEKMLFAFGMDGYKQVRDTIHRVVMEKEE